MGTGPPGKLCQNERLNQMPRSSFPAGVPRTSCCMVLSSMIHVPCLGRYGQHIPTKQGQAIILLPTENRHLMSLKEALD